MGTFLTGGNGFLGSYAIDWLLRNTDEDLFAMIRARDEADAIERFWQAMQFHVDEAGFDAALQRVTLVRGDLHAPGLGMSDRDRDRVLTEADSVLHVAASLNRKSDKACFNTNLRGTLSVVKLAMAMEARGTLRRFTDVSTAAVAGKRHGELVTEDGTIDWDRSDYDPYARTKKFAEHLSKELLPADRVVVLRPSTVMGDSRHERCWQTDMVRALVGLADMPIVPVAPTSRVDIVPGDWVGHAIGELHHKPVLAHQAYSLSAGLSSPTAGSIADALAPDRRMRLQGRLGGTFELTVRGMNRLPRGVLQRTGAVMKVFWPYITYDTVFDNTRAVTELGHPPTRFEDYCLGMVRYSRQVRFRNPVRPRRSAA
ncbi:MAG: SDR family oxidoreductase [Myxococcales bacterium]|nr:SDR family oxidoreductase [Myxococcales bacterium]